jgi:FkbM family methyltransferase
MLQDGTVVVPFGEGLEFETLKNHTSVRTAKAILGGETYPVIPAVRDVAVVLDVGANTGAASTFFSHRYPDARVLACEPAAVPYGILERNAQRRSNIETFNVGLSDTDDDVKLYAGESTSGTASVMPGNNTTDEFEQITLRSARAWLAERGITRVDVLKVDTEGCEVPIFESLRELLPSIKVVYLEFHSEADRKTIDRMFGDTHFLAVGRILMGQGEMVYVANRVAERQRAGAAP